MAEIRYGERERNKGRFILAVVLTAWPVLLVGCGLDDYEKRMDEQRFRLKAFDEEAKYLGPPLELPTAGDSKTEPDLTVLAVYLRPPQDIASKPSDVVYGVQTPLLYRYPGPAGYNVFLAGQLASRAARVEKGRKGEDFREAVIAALVQFYQTEYKKGIALQLAEPKVMEVIPLQTGDEKPKPIKFDQLIYEGPDNIPTPARFNVYFHKRGGDQIAIVYQVPKASTADTTLNRALDLSLKSFDLGESAVKKRAALSRR